MLLLMFGGVGRVVIAAVLFFGCTIPLHADETAFLGEMVPWPMQCAAITGASLDLTDTAYEEVRWVGGVEPVRFGLLPLGRGADPGITLVEYAQPGGPPLLLLDANNNEWLDDDVWRPPDERNGPRSYTWFVTPTPEYQEGGDPLRVPYRISVYAEYSYELQSYEYHYGGYSHRRGIVTIEGECYPIAVASMGSTGCYDDLDSLVIAVDLDRDGALNTLPYSHEAFGPGEPIVLPVGTYAMVWASPDGQRFHLRREGDGAARPIIARGQPAPPSTFTTIDGERITIPADGQRITVMLFIQRIATSDRGGCSSSSLLSRERVDDVRAALQGLAEDVVLVVVVEEPPPDGFRFEDGVRVPAHVVCDPATNELYRRSVGAFVIDTTGTIVAMDETWIMTPDSFGRPRGAYRALRGFEIRDTVDVLLGS